MAKLTEIDQNWQNLTKFRKNDKTPPRPVVVPFYQNSGRKNGLEMCPISKMAIFGLKMSKNTVFAVLTAPSSKVLRIRLQTMQIQKFSA